MPRKIKKYFPEIDLLKASAALLVVLIHVLARYKTSSDNMFLFWDLVHFSVGIFVLASGFLFQNSNPEIRSFKDLGIFMYKKFIRIVVPYYIFVGSFALFMGLSGKVDLTRYFNFEDIFETIFLWGGIGNNWIPRLFISMMLVVGLERLLVYKSKVKEIPYILFAIFIAGSIYLMTRDLDFLLKFNNLPGWLVIFYLGRFIYIKYEIKTFLILLVSGALISLILSYIFGIMGLDIGIFANKYPPNLYFVAYNVAASILLWGAVYALREVAQKNEKVWQSIKFISISSYEIFFYHLLIMEFWKYRINWFVDWVIISTITIVGLFIFKYSWHKLMVSVGYGSEKKNAKIKQVDRKNRKKKGKGSKKKK